MDLNSDCIQHIISWLSYDSVLSLLSVNKIISMLKIRQNTWKDRLITLYGNKIIFLNVTNWWVLSYCLTQFGLDPYIQHEYICQCPLNVSSQVKHECPLWPISTQHYQACIQANMNDRCQGLLYRMLTNNHKSVCDILRFFVVFDLDCEQCIRINDWNEKSNLVRIAIKSGNVNAVRVMVGSNTLCSTLLYALEKVYDGNWTLVDIAGIISNSMSEDELVDAIVTFLNEHHYYGVDILECMIGKMSTVPVVLQNMLDIAKWEDNITLDYKYIVDLLHLAEKYDNLTILADGITDIDDNLFVENIIGLYISQANIHNIMHARWDKIVDLSLKAECASKIDMSCGTNIKIVM